MKKYDRREFLKYLALGGIALGLGKLGYAQTSDKKGKETKGENEENCIYPSEFKDLYEKIIGLESHFYGGPNDCISLKNIAKHINIITNSLEWNKGKEQGIGLEILALMYAGKALKDGGAVYKPKEKDLIDALNVYDKVLMLREYYNENRKKKLERISIKINYRGVEKQVDRQIATIGTILEGKEEVLNELLNNKKYNLSEEQKINYNKELKEVNEELNKTEK